MVYYQRSNDPGVVAAVKKGFADIRRYIGLPTGLYGGDEALHGAAPTQGSELCTVVEMMYSLEEMAEITGDVQFARPSGARGVQRPAHAGHGRL